MFDNGEYQPVTRSEVCSLSAARRVAAMLDLPTESISEGDPLPKGWHFLLMAADTRRSDLRSDGFPGLGVPMPDLGFTRLLLGGRSTAYHTEIPVGAKVIRTSGITSLTQKSNASGPMAVVIIGHQIRLEGATEAAVTETQTYVLLPGQSRFKESVQAVQPITAARTQVVVPDETLLFQYSALGFNSHKIHIEKSYACEVEGFPDLVVNGGLTTLLLTEFARRELKLDLRNFSMKNVAPLFCGRPITLAADPHGEGWTLKAYDDTGKLAAEMEANVNEF
ncbi:hypothetical protein EOS_16830 [Caballeronia mineralivorans PML1(12)]|uniref:3-methylfumaryl-CoA hydratase n=1 Tax=Caballeronia mineralivorans PML1(12) TaxID=908627 RepID=A0A0J1FYD3_9BURK|nr:hypothetical protein [Caballeronia mineralivorans]KLU24963.1 hypothetical protein EOS_16830 [Caballeronia mineralivorans PML1(12)]